MKKATALFPFVLVLTIGCNSGNTSDPSSTGSSTTTSSSTGSKPSDSAPDKSVTVNSTSGLTPAGGPATATTPTKAASSSNTAADTVPADLKHSGYAYEGLGYTKPVDMELKIGGDTPRDLTGSQSIALDSVKDGKATYTITRTGGLETLGTDTMSLEKDGVYNMHATTADVPPHSLDMPADPTPGKTWQVRLKSDSAGNEMDMELTNKIVGKQSIKTKVATYPDALVVVQTGVGTMKKKKARMEGKSWYVKDLGIVKEDLKTFDDKNKATSLSIEETHR